MTNKIALITGGSRGLGRSMALHLAKQGIDIVFTYRGEAGEAEGVARRVKEAGARVAYLQLDVGNVSGFPAFAEGVRSALKTTFSAERFDHLVHNAGMGVHAPVVDTTEADFDRLIAVHLKGPLFLTQSLLPLINDGGRILNISTGLTRFTLPGYAAYASAKGGLEVLTRYLAKELGPRQISVNTLAPGAIATDFGGGVVRDNRDVNAWVASQTALGRVGEADDVGGAAAALLAGETAWITGTRIEVSGGQSI